MTTLILLALVSAIAAFVAPVATGTGLIGLGGFFVGVMGMLFDLALKFLVVQFEPTLYASIGQKIGDVWTAFRDIANIVIIGMFTFTAISLILGIGKFNARKMVARVLIIAILINFSLLFTRVIISSSNFVASQFYYAMALDTAAKTTGNTNPATGGVLSMISNYASTAGVSGQFINLLGLPSALSAYSTVDKVYSGSGGYWKGGGIMAIIYGFTTAVLMVVTALVLAYAIFLLIARTVLFLFLLVISALAFASYLVPKWGDHYWNMWWSSLLRSAVFAPLLMMMLWATLVISYALVKGPGQNRSFDKLFSDPTAGSGVLAIIIFLIILGMLIASIRFASAFSKSIAGFDYGTMLTAIPFALGARFAGAFARNTIGQGFAQRSERLGEAASRTREELGQLDRKNPNFARRQAFLQSRLNSLEKGQKMANFVADRKFSFASTDIGKDLLKKAGVPSILAGGGKGVVSYGENAKKVAEDAAKRAADATRLSSGNEKVVREEATKELRQQREILQKGIQISERNAKKEEEGRAAELQAHQDEIRRGTEERERLVREEPASAARDADMNTQKTRIENARIAIREIKKQIDENHNLPGQRQQLQSLAEEEVRVANKAVEAARDTLNEVGRNLAGSIASRGGSNVPWASVVMRDNFIVDQARGKFSKNVKEDDEEGRAVKALSRRLNRQGGSPTIPPTLTP